MYDITNAIPVLQIALTEQAISLSFFLELPLSYHLFLIPT